MTQSATILRDVLFYIKDFLDGEITDPIASSRPSGEKFIMTSYPTRSVTYPLITVKDLNSESPRILGLQSESMYHLVTIEIRIWARKVAERDKIADQVLDVLRLNQIGATGTSQANDLHDFKLLSSINVDEPGENNPKSKIMSFRFTFIDS